MHYFRDNANLAVSLAHTLLQRFLNNDVLLAHPSLKRLVGDRLPTITKSFMDGLEKMVWRGRFEKKKEKVWLMYSVPPW